jgi:protein O-mannosyl-transferase
MIPTYKASQYKASQYKASHAAIGRNRAGVVFVALAIALGALIGLLYFRALPVFFLSDDFLLLAFAKYNASGLGIFAVNPHPWSPFHRPLGLLAWKGLYRIWHEQAFGYHLFSFGLHWINSLLVVALARKLAPGRTLVACAAGALFALMPLHFETVIWISALFDLLATCWYLLTLLCLLVAWQRRSVALYILSLGIYQLCIWSKETAFTLPVMVVLLGLLLPQRPRRRVIVASALPYATLIGVSLLQRYLVWGTIGGYGGLSYDISTVIWGRINAALDFMMAPIHRELFSPRVVQLTLMAMAVLIGAGLLYAAERHVLLIAIGWLFLTLLPVLNVLPVAPNLQNTRFVYLPLVGFCFGIAIVVDDLAGRLTARHRRAVAAAGVGVLCAGYLVLGAVQIRPWIVAGRASENISDYIYRLLPAARAGSILQVNSLPDNYHGAYLYRLGMDAVMLMRFGRIIQLWPSTNATPIPYGEFAPTDDYYQVDLSFNNQTDSWDVLRARGVTSANARNTLPDTHWIYLMYAESALATPQAPIPTDARLKDIEWDFTNCAQADGWTIRDGLGQCAASAGLRAAASQTQTPLLVGPEFKLDHKGWVEVVVTMTATEPIAPDAYAQLFWKSVATEDWYWKRSLTINLPNDQLEHSYHFFVRLDEKPIVQIGLDPLDKPGDVVIKQIAIHPIP